MTIRTILVDDEPLAIQGLELRLQAYDDVEIIAKCQNGREAISAIKTHKPDLVFLDIQMPGFDGFSVVQGLMDVEPPLFVFVTAYSDHAIRAFEAQATDYLMKPVEEARLAETLDRVRQRLSERGSREEATKLKEALAEHAPEAAAEIAAESDGGDQVAAAQGQQVGRARAGADEDDVAERRAAGGFGHAASLTSSAPLVRLVVGSCIQSS